MPLALSEARIIILCENFFTRPNEVCRGNSVEANLLSMAHVTIKRLLAASSDVKCILAIHAASLTFQRGPTGKLADAGIIRV